MLYLGFMLIDPHQHYHFQKLLLDPLARDFTSLQKEEYMVERDAAFSTKIEQLVETLDTWTSWGESE